MSTAARIEELRKKFEENQRRYFAPLANELRKAGDVTQAIALCREFLPKQPGHMSGFIVFGQSLYEAGELEEARSVFEQALSLDPENLIALRHLGDIARASGDAATARRWYERVLDADPRNDDIAAQLSTLATMRPQTPAAPPAETFESVAARMSETPPVSMDAIGYTVMPTPDSVMRAIDLDGFESRFRDHAPIDLDADEAAHASRAESPELARPEDEAPAFTASEVAAPEIAAPELDVSVGDAPVDDAAIALEVPEFAVSFEEEDPFAFPEAVDAHTDAGASAVPEATSHVDAESTEANFEEGLIAANWPDTSELEARVMTPRSVTPISVTPLSSAALDDAIAAFGREPEPPSGFDDRADGLEPAVESKFEDEYVAPLEAFEATSVEVEGHASFADIGENVTIEDPVIFDAITDEMEVPAAFEPPNQEAESATLDAVTDEMPIPVSFDVAGDEVDAFASDAELFDAGSLDTASFEAASSEAASSDAESFASTDDAKAQVAPWEHDAQPVANADAARDDAVEAGTNAEDAVEAAAGSAVESSPESAAEASELPWLAVADSTSEVLGAVEEAEPGLEEIAGVFADDARSAGDHGAVTVAALDAPMATGESESFADVAQQIDDEAHAIAAEAQAISDEAASSFDEDAEREVVEVHSAHAGTPATGSPAFVTETMGELLVAQGFVVRAVEVYEELVRRRPFDPVLSSRLEELRTMMSPVVEQAPAEAAIEADEAEIEAEASAPDDTTFGLFAPVMSDEFDVGVPTPAYGTPVSATPVMSVSALSAQAYQTPAHATPAFTQRVTPTVTPYAQPSVTEEFAPRRSAGEWFAALAARRVPRRTPTQSSPAIESSPEGLASLFGDSGAGDDDAAARALADAFAPLSERDLESGAVLDFDFARATPAFSPAMPTPAGASATTPSHTSTPSSFTAATTPPAAPASGANAGFSFDKFFPDPATRRGTPAAPSPTIGNPPVSDDLAQFSAWLKGLGNS